MIRQTFPYAQQPQPFPAARAEEIAKGNWAAEAVRKAIDEITAAVTTSAAAAVSG